MDFCCLSLDDDIVTGSFYPYEVNDGERGLVRVVIPNQDAEGNAALVGLGSSKFVSAVNLFCFMCIVYHEYFINYKSWFSFFLQVITFKFDIICHAFSSQHLIMVYCRLRCSGMNFNLEMR